MIELLLKELGLDDLEVATYLQMLQNEVNRVSTLAYQLKVPRTTLQSVLLRLEEHEMVTKVFNKNTAHYSPIHPEDLLQIIEMRRRKANSQLDELTSNLKKAMPELESLMQSHKDVPNIKFYQGKDGVRKVLFDTLTSKTELKGFINVEAMNEQVLDINSEYVAEREKSQIKKRAFILDTPKARANRESGKYSPKSYIAWKWINKELYPFSIETNIYDGKISYITYVENNLLGVIIKNDYIYEMHKSIWNLLWDTLPEGGYSKFYPKNYKGD